MKEQSKNNSSIFKLFFRHKNDISPEPTLLGTSYAEQYLTVEKLAEVYSDSFIDAENPEKSDGLNLSEAEKRLKDGGSNSIPSVQKISTIKLFFKQFLHKFWILLLIAAILCFISFGTNKYFGRLGNLSFYCGIILVFVVLFMSILSFWEQRKALNVINDFKNLIPKKSYVIRDSIERYISSESIVVGDIVVISSGKVIPADIRILKSNGLKIESAIITGITKAVNYISEAVPRNINVFDARNIAFKGSFCVEGDGIGVVIRIGPYTALGHLHGIKKHIQLKESRLQKDVKNFIRFISLFSVILAFIIIIIGIIVSKFEHILYHFSMGFVIVVVACIPQNLPAIILSQYSIIARKLAKNNVLIKKSDIIDKLATCTIMCIEKTGILTENKLEVNGIWINGKDTEGKSLISTVASFAEEILVLMPKKQNKSVITIDEFNTEFKHYITVISPLITVMTICNNAQFDHINGLTSKVATRKSLKKFKQEHSGIKNLTKSFTVVDAYGHSKKIDPANISKLENGFITENKKEHQDCDIIGGPVDVALLKYTNQLTEINSLRNSYLKLMEIPFNPIRRWHLTISRCQKTPVGVDFELLGELKTDVDVNVVMLKGDPMAVLKKCKFYSFNGKLMEIDEKFKAKCREKWEEYGKHGFRVIAFAMKHFISKKTEKFSVNSNNYPINDLVFLGMVSMFDPPKKEIIKSMKKFKEAGIKIIMVTGDPESSVLALAKEIGIISNEESQHFIEKTVPSKSNWTLKAGDNLSLYTSTDWDKTFQHEIILFSHVNPTQKLQIVQEAQKRKESVAFAGINSVSAIAAADIGIAFSDISTDFVQNVAGIIITENFSLILKGIEEGRQMFNNFCLSIAFTLSHFWAEIFPIFLTFIFEMPLALQPLQILLINLITDLLSSILLIYENNPKTDIMKLPPRNQKRHLIPCSLFLYAYGFVGIAMALGCFGAYLSVFWYYGNAFKDLVLTSEDFWDYNPRNLTISSGNVFNGNQQVFIRQQASAAWQGTLILAQIFHLILCKTRTMNLFQNKTTFFITFFVVILQLFSFLALIYAPPLQNIFEIQPPPFYCWIFAVIFGIYLFVLNESRKFLARKWPNNKISKFLEF